MSAIYAKLHEAFIDFTLKLYPTFVFLEEVKPIPRVVIINEANNMLHQKGLLLLVTESQEKLLYF